ncbi:3-oxoadipate CoA-transferase subunit B (EC 2.8.3.6), partial [Arthrobacter sp. DR-2P]
EHRNNPPDLRHPAGPGRPRPFGGPGHRTGILCEPGHRPAHPCLQLPHRGAEHHAAHGERDARHGPRSQGGPDRRGPHQRRQDPRHGAPRCLVLPPRRLLRDDARRAPGHLRARRVPGISHRRPRQLAHRRTRGDPRCRRRHGPRHRRQGRLRHDDPPHPRRRLQARGVLHLPAHRRRLRHPRLHGQGRVPHRTRGRHRPRDLRLHPGRAAGTCARPAQGGGCHAI